MGIELVKTRGYVALVGEAIEEMASHDLPISNPDAPHHVTLLTKDEVRRSDTNIEELLASTPGIESPLDLGLGQFNNVYFKVLLWPQGDVIRKQIGLPTKQFHITLSSTDDHTIDKGVKSIVRPTALTSEQVEIIVSNCLSTWKSNMTRSSTLDIIRFLIRFHVSLMTDKSFDAAWRILSKTGNEIEAPNFAFYYASLKPDSIAANLRSADSCDVEKDARRAMHYYAQAAHLALSSPSSSSNLPVLCAKGILRCSQYTEFGPFFRETELDLWKADRDFFLQTGEAFRNPDLRCLVQNEFAERMESQPIDMLVPELLSLPSRCHAFSIHDDQLFEMPRFFRWLLPFRLAVMSTPRCKADIKALAAQNITLVVTLTEEEPLPAEWFAESSCRNVFIPVRNYRAPSIQQINTFLKLMDDLPAGEAALVHCGGGKGRAGTFAACYLMARGFRVSRTEGDPQEDTCLFPADVMRLLRHMRPGSIETAEQENFIKRYARESVAETRKGGTEVDDLSLMEPQHPLQSNGSLPSKPSIIVCCGVPGSGKSTFSALLANHLGYVVISQDELGSRGACLTALGNALQAGRHILIDRCNPYVEDREEWLAHAFHPKDALCVWFDIDKELCVRRADARVNHPTIAQGRARKVITSFSKTFAPPSSKEKFTCIARVPSTSASSELLLKLGVRESQLPTASLYPEPISSPPVVKPEKQFIYKFPRTRHLYNLGSATRDDLLLTPSDASAFLHPTTPTTTLTLEEKVDGANLGISLSTQTPFGFKIQNRSHYITSKSHAQFKKLDKWVEDHSEGLRKILSNEENDGEEEEGRWILYGEWLHAKHSIPYTSLPDKFLAFDLFDTSTKTFLSRASLTSRLANTNIIQVPEIQKPEFLDKETLLELVEGTASKFYDGVVEGIYFRRENAGKTVDRAKVVRKDFIAGDEHWSRGGVVVNGVTEEREW